MPKIQVHKDICIGCGNCVNICPEVFEIQDAKAQVRPGQEESKNACAVEAQSVCPVSAIEIN